MAKERDVEDRGTGGVFGGTPDEQRNGTPTGRGVYPGTPGEKGGIGSERGGSDGQAGGDYGPLGWADVPGRPRPQVDEGPEDR